MRAATSEQFQCRTKPRARKCRAALGPLFAGAYVKSASVTDVSQ